jgi:hypothetical protein
MVCTYCCHYTIHAWGHWGTAATHNRGARPGRACPPPCLFAKRALLPTTSAAQLINILPLEQTVCGATPSGSVSPSHSGCVISGGPKEGIDNLSSALRIPFRWLSSLSYCCRLLVPQRQRLVQSNSIQPIPCRSNWRSKFSRNF